MAKPRTTPMLAGWYVISLRPSGSHAAVRRAAAALGARLLSLSTLKLQALDAGAALDAALACPLVIATSPAAVRHARAQRPLRAQPDQRWMAIGAGTAAQLQRCGIAEVQVPEGRSDSEGLLARPDLQSLPEVAVGLVTAPGGRGLIAETLAQRGARVHLAEVYRRVPLRPRSDRLHMLATLPSESALLVSSGEAFDGLWSALPAGERQRLQSRPAVASSPRLAAKLAAAGFQTLVLAEGAAPGRMLAALAADVAAGRFR